MHLAVCKAAVERSTIILRLRLAQAVCITQVADMKTRALLLGSAALLGSIVVWYASCQARRPPSHQKSLGIEAYAGAQDLYAFTEAQRAKYGWPALGVGVIHRGKIVALGMAGERKVGSASGRRWTIGLRWALAPNRLQQCSRRCWSKRVSYAGTTE